MKSFWRMSINALLTLVLVFLSAFSLKAQIFSSYELHADCGVVSQLIPDNFTEVEISDRLEFASNFELELGGILFDRIAISQASPTFFFLSDSSDAEFAVFAFPLGIDLSKFSTSKIEFAQNDTVVALRYTDVGHIDLYEDHVFGQGFAEKLDFTIGVTTSGRFFAQYDEIDWGDNPFFQTGEGLLVIDPDIFVSPGMQDTLRWQHGLLVSSFLPDFGSVYVNEVTPNNFIADTRNRRDRTLKFERDTSVCFLLSRSDVSSTTEIEPSTQHHTACNIHSLAEANARLNVSPAFTKLVHLTTDGHWQEIQKPITKDEAYEGWYIFSHLAKGEKCPHSFHAIE